MEKKFVGIDIGTTAIKIVVVSQNMTIHYEKNYTYHYDILKDGWLEISPQVWQDIIFKAMDELMRDFPCQLSAIGITGQMHTTVFLDSSGQVIRPAILWNDMRTKSMIPEIKQKILGQTSVARIAETVSNGSPLSNLIWLKRYEKTNFHRLQRVMMPVNYLNYLLTGVESMDYCDASTTSLYNLDEKEWAWSVFDVFDLPKTLFPPVRPASQVIANLKEELLHRWHQQEPVAVVTGTGDNVAAAFATGSFETGQPIVSLGTSGVVVIPGCAPHFKAIGKNVVAEIFENDKTIITQGTVQSGAKVNSWWMEKILERSDFLEAQNEIEKEQLGHNDVLFFPHLTGEKTLFANPDLRGCFIGLHLETTSSQMYLAVLEGLAFSMYMLFQKMREDQTVDYLSIVGGGANSKLWVQLFADIFNHPIRKLHSPCEAVHGAARLAIISQEPTAQFEEKEEWIYPDKDRAVLYQEGYVNYKRLASLVREYYQ